MTIQNSVNIIGGLPVSVEYGGTGLNTLTNGGILVGQGIADVLPITLDDGELLIGSTGNDPVAATLTAGFGISITNGAGSITIAATGMAAAVEVTGTTQTMAVNTAYIANNAGLVTLTLPATAALGDRLYVTAKGAGLFRIAQNSGQQIHFLDVSTTSGATGFLDATERYSAIELQCITANNEFVVVDASGNFDLV